LQSERGSGSLSCLDSLRGSEKENLKLLEAARPGPGIDGHNKPIVGKVIRSTLDEITIIKTGQDGAKRIRQRQTI